MDIRHGSSSENEDHLLSCLIHELLRIQTKDSKSAFYKDICTSMIRTSQLRWHHQTSHKENWLSIFNGILHRR